MSACPAVTLPPHTGCGLTQLCPYYHPSTGHNGNEVFLLSPVIIIPQRASRMAALIHGHHSRVAVFFSTHYHSRCQRESDFKNKANYTLSINGFRNGIGPTEMWRPCRFLFSGSCVLEAVGACVTLVSCEGPSRADVLMGVLVWEQGHHLNCLSVTVLCGSGLFVLCPPYLYLILYLISYLYIYILYPVMWPPVSVGRRRHRTHKFLCLRVGKPMKKTFLSNASASMQQYAQRDKKHEYWFAVPQERWDLRHHAQTNTHSTHMHTHHIHQGKCGYSPGPCSFVPSQSHTHTQVHTYTPCHSI